MYTSLKCVMARNGYRIFDSDTHVGPYMEVLERYLSDEEKQRLAGWEAFKSKSNERVVYTKGQRRYLRKRMDPRIRPAGAGHGDVTPRELPQGTFEQPLDGRPGGLALPADEIGAIVGEGELERWHPEHEVYEVRRSALKTSSH